VLAASLACKGLLKNNQATAEGCQHVGIKALSDPRYTPPSTAEEEELDYSCCHGFLGGFHQPWKPPKIPATSVTAAMFRDPFERVVSAFYYNQHSFSKKPAWFSGSFRSLVLDEVAKMDTGLATFSSLSSVQNCYAKMLSDRSCGDPVESLSFDEASRAIQALDFIGITSQWNASICLFHASFGLRDPDYGLQGLNVRPGSYSLDDVPSAVEKLIRMNERIDSELYTQVTGIFIERVHQFPQCASLLQFGPSSGLSTPGGWR